MAERTANKEGVRLGTATPDRQEISMNRAGFKPLQNTSLPHLFRHIRLERAREHSRRGGRGRRIG